MKQSVPETSKLRFGHPARNEAESRFHVFVCFVPFGRGVSAVEDEPVLAKEPENLISQSWRFGGIRLERATALKSFAIKADLPMLDQSRSGLGFPGFFLSNSILLRGHDASGGHIPSRWRHGEFQIEWYWGGFDFATSLRERSMKLVLENNVVLPSLISYRQSQLDDKYAVSLSISPGQRNLFCMQRSNNVDWLKPLLFVVAIITAEQHGMQTGVRNVSRNVA